MSLASSAPSCGAHKQRGCHARLKPSPLRLQRSTSVRILFSSLKRPAFLPTVSLAFKRMRNSAAGSSLPALAYPLSCLLWVATKLQSGTSPVLLSSRQTSQAETPPPVKTRPVRCTPSFLEPGTLLSEPCLVKISSKAMFAFPLPAGPPRWLFSLSAQIYAAPTLTSSRVRDLPNNSQT